MMRNFTVVALDESGGWCVPGLVERCGGAIYTLYAYDPGEQTRCCEITPSFWLVPFDVAGKNPYPDDEQEREELYDILQGGMNDTEWEGIYVHCHRIEALDPKFKHTEEFDESETLDDAVDHFRGNGTVPEALL